MSVRQEREDPGLRAVVAAIGNLAELGRRLGLSGNAPCLWKRVPVHHVLTIEKMFPVTCKRHLLRPDIYPPPVPRQPAKPRQLQHDDRTPDLFSRSVA
jgi:hypothetical protein